MKEIYRTQKALLGFFPDEAFQQRADAKQILIAWSDSDAAGYVLFATNQRYEVRITHLCVKPDYGNRKIAKQLIAALVEAYPNRSRIRLNCRVDYEAAGRYRRMGFSELRRFPGKKQGGSELIAFALAINETPLFDALDEPSETATVVCDTMVCIDIEDQDRPHHKASSGLRADWLVDEINLKVTPGIFADLGRQAEPLRSDMISAVKTGWDQVAADHLEVERQLREVRQIMGEPKDDSSASDQRHIAIAAAIEAAAFVTRDEEVLSFREQIQSSLGLRLLPPAEFITEYDAVLNSHRYQYRELSRSGIERRRVASIDEFDLKCFIDSAGGESLKVFRAELIAMLAAPREWEIYRVCSRSDECIALFAIRILDGGARDIQRLRLSRRLVGTRFGRILAEYFADQPLGAWRSGQRRTVTISDRFATPLVLGACSRRGWCQADGALWRLSLPGQWSQDSLSAELSAMSDSGIVPVEFAEQISRSVDIDHNRLGNEVETQQLERLIHPGKVTFGQLPTWVIPIQPRWAQELFDFRLWDLPLFDPETSLVINPDSAYYKSPRQGPSTPFGRILWYVSGDKRKGGGRVRACSTLTKRVQGTVKNLFREFQRFGVYEWRHLMENFKDADAQGLAIEFTSTELFETPITFEVVNDVLESHGMKRQQFISAVLIPDSAFQEIYSRSTQREH
ncbi:Acetyltransferase (GNAT) family protein [Rosistilla oblonga]|nr:Acetyltransferase (GNAT) family protein [Rosistilla oblonga]